jgi:hypothetical protein
VPLHGVGLASRSLLGRWREKLLAAGSAGKMALGLIQFTTGILILTGARKALAAKLVQILLQWFIELTPVLRRTGQTKSTELFPDHFHLRRRRTGRNRGLLCLLGLAQA